MRPRTVREHQELHRESSSVNAPVSLDTPSSPRRPRGFAVVLIILGFVFAIGGARLAVLGGSWYYLLTGLCLVANGALLWKGRRSGAQLYGLVTLATVIWALAESGFDGWALAPRILPFLAIGSWLLRMKVRRALSDATPRPLRSLPATWVTLAALVVIVVGVALHEPYPTLPFPQDKVTGFSNESRDWRAWGGNAEGTRFVPFDHINTGNAENLEVAWTQRTGVGGSFKGTPLQIGDSLFVCFAGNVVASLDVDTGAERWRFDPKVNVSPYDFSGTCRGVSYYEAPQPQEICRQRILTATTDARLFAMDAKTGKPCSDFGANGEINLLEGMGEVKPGFYFPTSPPAIVRGVAVIGGWVADNVEVQEPSGVIRAFDVLTGRMVWAWDLGRTEVLTTPPPSGTYTRGTPNAWSVFSADEALGMVYIPTGNATPDYVGSHRTPESERFASSVVALDAATGALRWSFQTTHHDIWDYDVPSQPVLANIRGEGDEILPALIAPTKRGELFLLDRRTGKPIAEVEERPVPQTDVPGEWTSKTQPFSVGMPAFGREPLTEAKMWGITPIDQMLCRIKFRESRYEGPLTPPSLNGTIQSPGFGGGMNWGSVSVDEAHGVMITNTLNLSNWMRLYPRDEVTEETALGSGGGFQFGTPYAAFTESFMSPLMAPCEQPPYGEVAAIDLNTRKLLWRRPLGTANELGPLGLKLKLPIPMGVPYTGGTIVTSGGLVFMGGTMDRRLRALDISTGKELWSAALPNNAEATPMSYVSPQTHRQFVVIAVPATQDDLAQSTHVVQPEAQGSTSTTVTDKQVDSGNAGGWIIAYALPSVSEL